MNEKEKMRFCAFADVASTSLSWQIEALGRNSIDLWKSVEFTGRIFQRFLRKRREASKNAFLTAVFLCD